MTLKSIYRSSNFAALILWLLVSAILNQLGFSFVFVYLTFGLSARCFYELFGSKKIKDGEKWKVVVIGAGMSGLDAAKKLKDAGIDFVVLEKATQLGGTWWFNTYPGVACDVPSHLYSLSYYLNPWWTKAYSKGDEIERYLIDFANEFGLIDKIKFNTKVTGAVWDEATHKWTVTTESGDQYVANVVFSGIGALHFPLKPTFKNQDQFKGKIIHSAEWSSNLKLKGKKVAIIGTGASCVQIAPSIANEVKTLHVFQRTPCWVPPRMDYFFDDRIKKVFNWFPPAMLILRWFIYLRNEFRFQLVFHSSRQFLANIVQGLLKKEMQKMIQDPVLEEKLIPKYAMGCKRITPSDLYLGTFRLSHVNLVTDGIDSFTSKGIKSKSGKEFEFDVIILATGFSIFAAGQNLSAIGKAGKNLQTEWGDAPSLYKGSNYPGFPNLFFILGPGTGLGHSSIIYIIECQSNYAMDCLKKLISSGHRSMDVKEENLTSYLKMTGEMMKNKVFRGTSLGGSCSAWYSNERGVNWTLWPGNLIHFWYMTKKCDFGDYQVR